MYAGLSPVIETVMTSILWAYYSPQNVMVTRPYSFMLAVGLLFSFLVVKKLKVEKRLIFCREEL